MPDRDEHELPTAHIYDGPPRYSHKSTRCAHRAHDHETNILAVIPNYELGEVLATNHFGGGRYGVQRHSIVIPKGQDKSSKFCPPGCDHNVEGSKARWRIKSRASDAVHDNRLTTPKTFEGSDVCAHAAARYACEDADTIIAVQQMLPRIKLPDEYDVILDEESTMEWFFPNGGMVGELELVAHAIGEYNYSARWHARPSVLRNVAQDVRRQIDEYTRVPGRWTALRHLTVELGEFLTKLEAVVNEHTDVDDAVESIRELEPPSFEHDLGDRELDRFIEEVRVAYSQRWGEDIPHCFEAMMFDPRLEVTRSGSSFKIEILPDHESGFIAFSSIFLDANEIICVGNEVAKHFLDELGVEEYEHEVLDEGHNEFRQRQRVFGISFEHQRTQRGKITAVSDEIAYEKREHLLFAGSAERAAKREHPRSHFLGKQAGLEELHDQLVGANFRCTSYAGSKISRGVDTPNELTLVRSGDFSTGIFPEDSPIGRYKRATEVMNMMLRGAGRGLKHVAVIPAEIVFADWFESLLEDVMVVFHEPGLPGDMEFDVERVVNHALAFLLGAIVDGGMWRCTECESSFVTFGGWHGHHEATHVEIG